MGPVDETTFCHDRGAARRSTRRSLYRLCLELSPYTGSVFARPLCQGLLLMVMISVQVAEIGADHFVKRDGVSLCHRFRRQRPLLPFVRGVFGYGRVTFF